MKIRLMFTFDTGGRVHVPCAVAGSFVNGGSKGLAGRVILKPSRARKAEGRQVKTIRCVSYPRRSESHGLSGRRA